MKKYLVVLLALAMVFALATTAMAADNPIPDYTDVQAGVTPYASDIYRLTALGVTVGDGLGTNYRPADNLTREEFAKIACYMFGIQNQKAYFADQKSAFSDVAEGKWSEGYINCANYYGLMVGVGGGKFAPTAKVSTAEVAAVVLRAVGYDKNLPGTWPNKYIAKANEAKAMWTTQTLGDYVFPIGMNAATRAQVAGIVNYALDMYKVAYVGKEAADADKDGFAYRTADTNEASIYNYFLNPLEAARAGYITLGSHNEITFPVDKLIGQKATVLWNVFHAIEVPYLFDPWDEEFVNLAEGYGWGFEDFEDGELVFTDFLDLCVPVATDYYIYDESLDGELWQVSGRFADLTVKIETTQFKAHDFKGVEALYADLQADVEYVDADTKIDGETYNNSNIYSLQDDFLNGFVGAVDCYAAYDYDDYSAYPFNIVDSNDGKKLKDAAGVIVNYDKDNSAFLSLEQGGFVAPETIAKGDVIYNTKNLLNYDNTKNLLNYDADLYIVISPKAGSLDPQLNLGSVKIDGVKELSQVKGNGTNSFLNAGFGYVPYAFAWTTYSADMDGARDIAWAPSYAKKYFAYISDGIFDKVVGVITNIEKEISFKDSPFVAHGPAIAWSDAVAITIFDKNGEETTYAVDEDDVLGLLAEGDLVTLLLKNDGAYAASLYDAPGTGFPYGMTHHIFGIEIVDDNVGKIQIEYIGPDANYVLPDDVVIFSLTSDGNAFDSVELIDRADFLAEDYWWARYAWCDGDYLYIINAEADMDGYHMDLINNSGAEKDVEVYNEGGEYYAVINGDCYGISEAFYNKMKDFNGNGLLIWEYDHNADPVGIYRAGIICSDESAKDVDAPTGTPDNSFTIQGDSYGLYYGAITKGGLNEVVAGRHYTWNSNDIYLGDDTKYFDIKSGEELAGWGDIDDEDKVIIVTDLSDDDTADFVLVNPKNFTPSDKTFFIWD